MLRSLTNPLVQFHLFASTVSGGRVYTEKGNSIFANNKFLTDAPQVELSHGTVSAVLLGNTDESGFARGVMHLLEHYPQNVIHCLMNSLSTHDTPRIRSLLNESLKEDGEKALYAAYLLLFTLPGIPCIYLQRLSWSCRAMRLCR